MLSRCLNQPELAPIQDLDPVATPYGWSINYISTGTGNHVDAFVPTGSYDPADYNNEIVTMNKKTEADVGNVENVDNADNVDNIDNVDNADNVDNIDNVKIVVEHADTEVEKEAEIQSK